jgi:preprotein translocase subunit SecE
VARQTRSERRARRAEAAPPVERRAPRAPAPTPAVDGGGDRKPPRPVERQGGRDPFRFFRESFSELEKVEWPGQKQVIAGTTVVLIACIVVGAYLWANDLVWKHFVQNVLLK